MSLNRFAPRLTTSRLLTVAAAIFTVAAALTGGTAAATPRSPASTSTTQHVLATSHAPAGSGAPVSATAPAISSLAVTGSRTTVTVRKVYRSGQVSWISHVLDTSLTDLDGCQARRLGTTHRKNRYRAEIDAACPSGTAGVEAAVTRLRQTRPWYRISVQQIPLVGFTLLADVPTGNAEAAPAALAQLPSGDFVFSDGDDVSVNYVGPTVTQAQLQSAVKAFAKALKISAGAVKVSPIAG